MARDGDDGSNDSGSSWRKRIKIIFRKMKGFPGLLGHTMWEVGREDPKRVIHSLKVGVALTLVSLLYLMEPFFKGIGENAIWAVMTVVVVLEYTAGATLCKGLNRGIGTLLAGSLAFVIECVANKSGRVFHAACIGTAVFLVGVAATYTRFFPRIKMHYEYGVIIFVLTFNMITVLSYRVDNVLTIAQQRFYTIAIGCGVCLVMSLLIFPKWSGEELHSSTVFKLEGLAKSLEVCVNEYFNDADLEVTEDSISKDSIYEGYKDVLDSKFIDETLALYASWEPRHSRYCQRFPWQQYVKVGSVLRHFGYALVALHGCLQTEIQTPWSVRVLFKDPCVKLAMEVSKVLTELALSIKNRSHSSPEILSDHLHQALADLNSALNSQPRLFLGSNNNRDPNILALAATHAQNDKKESEVSLASAKPGKSTLPEWRNKKATGQSSKEGEQKSLRTQFSKIIITSIEFSEALPFAAFASLLVELVAKLDNVIDEVEELGRIACFKEYKDGEMVVVTCETPSKNVAAANLPFQGVD